MANPQPGTPKKKVSTQKKTNTKKVTATKKPIKLGGVPNQGEVPSAPTG